MGNGGLAGIGVQGGNKDSTLPAHAHAGGTHAHGLGGHSHGFSGGTGTVSADHVHNATIENAEHSHYLNMGRVLPLLGRPGRQRQHVRRARR